MIDTKKRLCRPYKDSVLLHNKSRQVLSMLQSPDINNSHLQKIFAEYGGFMNFCQELNI